VLIVYLCSLLVRVIWSSAEPSDSGVGELLT